MRYISAPFRIKALNEDGSFSGHASVFGNVDSYKEVVLPGAFKTIVKNEDGKVVVLWQHNVREPIGVADVQEDAKGLAFEGSLVLEDPAARKARAHMLAKSVRAMSIGYDVVKDFVKNGVRYLEEVKLYEISVCTFGANELAMIDYAKNAGNITTIREFEDFLRDVGGFSKSQAMAIAGGGWKTLSDRRDSGESDDVKNFANFLKSITEKTS